MTSPLFSNLDGLIGLARHGVDVKPTLLRVLTDLYVQKPAHSAAEERQYVELALRLIDAVDAPTRKAVSDRLAAYPAAPAALVRHLADNGATVAAVQQDVPANPDADAGPASEKTAQASEITERFFAGDAAERRAFLLSLGTAGAPPPANAEEINRNLEASVLGGRPGDFIRQLEQSLAVPRALAERIVNDLSGEPLVIAAKALAMPIDMLQRILLFVNPAVGQSVRRVYDLSALYGEISAGAAALLVACWRQLSSPVPRRPASHARAGHSATAAQTGSARPERRDSGTSPHDVEKVAS